METLRLTIGGMSCGHCVEAVRRAVELLPGVDVLDVTIGEAKVSVSDTVATDKLVGAIADAGYRVTAVDRALVNPA